VKKIRRDCVVFRRNQAKPGEQMMADLIESRLDYGALPFTRTAVDLLLCIQSVRGNADGPPIVDGRGPRWRVAFELKS
jgi:hypothetical protein